MAGAILASVVMCAGLREGLRHPGAANKTTAAAVPFPPLTTAMLLLVVSIFHSVSSVSSAEVVDTCKKLTKTEKSRNTKTDCR